MVLWFCYWGVVVGGMWFNFNFIVIDVMGADVGTSLIFVLVGAYSWPVGCFWVGYWFVRFLGFPVYLFCVGCICALGLVLFV